MIQRGERLIVCASVGAIRGKIGGRIWESGSYETAARLFETMVGAETLDDFMTLVAYERID